METKIDCPVCDGQTFLPLFEKRGEHFVRCKSCQLTLINPRPPAKAVEQTYDPAYSQHYIRKADKKLKRCRRWVNRVQRRFVREGSWLDVGCSAGFVVAAAKAAGFDAHGIEIESAAVKYARSTLDLDNVVVGVLEEHNYAEQSFDVISLYDVIEHVPDLNRVVGELKRILKPAGVIEIRTPDIGHWSTPSKIETWKEVKPSEHLYYFNRETLPMLFARHNLQLIYRRLMFKPAINMFFQHA